MDFLSFIPAEWLNLFYGFLTLLGAVVAFASLIVPMTKSPKDDEALAWVKNLLARFSTFGHRQ